MFHVFQSMTCYEMKLKPLITSYIWVNYYVHIIRQDNGWKGLHGDEKLANTLKGAYKLSSLSNKDWFVYSWMLFTIKKICWYKFNPKFLKLWLINISIFKKNG